jgi:uncharacterized protein YprB with RNaseH-like and TPR domain
MPFADPPSSLARLLRAGLLRRGELAPAPESEPAPEPRAAAIEPPLEELVEGRWITLGEQRCYVTDRLYSWADSYGDAPLTAFLEAPDAQWTPFACLEPDQPFALRRAALLDIETTGLARGAGTYAFMVGLGLPGDDGLRVRQFFMPAYGDEEALLDLLAADLRTAEGLVTFNGRSFDWPILRARFVLARRPLPLDDAPHLDLLTLARRLWRRRLDSCALSSLETHILGVQRTDDDVPGYLIPQLYQDYLELGRTRPLVGIFYHNRMDILAMAALAGRVGRLLATPQHAEAIAVCDFLALGMLYERTARLTEALEAYQTAAQTAHDAGETVASCKCHAALLKRLGRLEEACQVWQGQLGGEALYPYIELSKVCEHRQGDYAAAQRLVRQALDWVDTRAHALGRAEHARLRDELSHRLERLERRVSTRPTAGTLDSTKREMP